MPLNLNKSSNLPQSLFLEESALLVKLFRALFKSKTSRSFIPQGQRTFRPDSDASPVCVGARGEKTVERAFFTSRDFIYKN